MDKAQATAVAEKIVDEFSSNGKGWRVCIHRQMSHLLDKREVHLELVIGGYRYAITELLPDDFFAKTTRRFELSFSVAAIKDFSGICQELLDFLDGLLAEMELAFVLDDAESLTTSLLEQVSSVEDIPLFCPLLKELRIGDLVFSTRQSLSLQKLLPPRSVQAIKATAGLTAPVGENA